MDKKCFISDKCDVLYNITLTTYFLLDLLLFNIAMIFLHRKLDGSLSQQVYLQVKFYLLLDHLDTSSSPYLLVF